jgi:type IV pilus assembly protein PilA
MLYRLRQRSQDEAGFTLIELLVVILIIGILAAIAIPSLLAQKSKAYSASAKTLASSAQTAAETYGTDNNEEFKELSPTVIHEYEKNIPITEAAAKGSAWLSEAKEVEKGAGYKVEVTAGNTKEVFAITRKANGEVEKTCAPNVEKGCPASGKW